MTKISNLYSLSNYLTVDTVNGRIGIGTASPSDKLNVVVSSNGNVARFDGPTSGLIIQTNSSTTDIISYGGTTPAYRALNFATGASTAFSLATTGAATFSSSVTATNVYLGSLTNEQLMISGTASRGIGVSTITSGDPYVRLYDNTTIKGDIWWSRTGNYMGVNSLGAGSVTAINPFGGSVGIGTNSPSAKLHVEGNMYISDTLSLGNWFNANSKFSGYTTDGLFSANARPCTITTPNGGQRIKLGYFDYGGGQYYGRIGFAATTNWSLGTIGSAGNDFSIGTGASGQAVTITSAGNIGMAVTNPSHRLQVSGNIYSSDTVFARNVKPEAWASVTAGTPSAAGIPLGYSTISINTITDNNWRVVLSNINDVKGYFWVTLGDAASKDTANYMMAMTSPSYGVSNFGVVSYQDNGWNTGGFEFTTDTTGGTYRLLVRCTSYYSGSATAYGNIYFLRLE